MADTASFLVDMRRLSCSLVASFDDTVGSGQKMKECTEELALAIAGLELS